MEIELRQLPDQDELAERINASEFEQVKERTSNDGRHRYRYYKHLLTGEVYKMGVYYSQGGISYWDYSTIKQGFYLSITPVELSEWGESCVLGGNKSGYKHFLLPATRFSAKKLGQIYNQMCLPDPAVKALLYATIERAKVPDR